MMNQRSLLLLFSVLLLVVRLAGITGRILSEDGLGIEGASITDGSQYVFSATDGSFSINSLADSLQISRIGYHPQIVSTRALVGPIILRSDLPSLEPIWVRAEFRQESPALGANLILPENNTNLSTAGDLLLSNSSFFTTDTRLRGERQTVSLLGSYSRHSLVLLDGVAQNADGEEYDFSKIPIEQIDHIEVIKGNASAYGGSAAIGGIIHIHTKEALRKAEYEADLQSETGSYDYFKQQYRANLRRGPWAAVVDFSHQDAFNDFYYDTPEFWGMDSPLPRKHNRKQSDGFYSKLSYLKKALKLDYGLNLGSFVKELPGPINYPDLYDASRLTGRYRKHNLHGSLAGKQWSHQLTGWSYSDYSLYRNLDSSNPIARSHYSQEQINQGLQAGTSYSLEDTKLSILAEMKDVEYIFKNYINQSLVEGERENAALAFRAGQSLYPSLLQWKLALAIRGDWSGEGFHPSWRLEQEIKLPWSEEILIGGYLGKAFSQPSLFDMYWIGDSETQGNPDLESESSLGYNLYLSWALSSFKIKAAYYHNTVENLIQWRQYYLNGMTWKPFNVGKAMTTNYELDASWQWKFLSLSGALTKTEAKDRSLNPDGSHSATYNKNLVYTPDLRANLSLTAGNDIRGISLAYSYTGKQYSTMDNLIEPLPAFDSLDAESYYKINLGSFSLMAGLNLYNLLDKRYEIYAYTPQPGRNWTASLRLAYSSF